MGCKVGGIAWLGNGRIRFILTTWDVKLFFCIGINTMLKKVYINNVGCKAGSVEFRRFKNRVYINNVGCKVSRLHMQSEKAIGLY